MGKKAVTEDIKNQIIGLHLAKESARSIGRKLKISHTCAANTINKYKNRGCIKDKKRSGRPTKTTYHEDRMLYRLARSKPTASLTHLTREINSSTKLPISRSTVSKRLIARRLCSFKAAEKPRLSLKDKQVRLKFCHKILEMSQYELDRIIFSDESNFQVVNRKTKVLVRRFPSEKYEDRMLVPRLQGGGGSVGIWGCITSAGPGLYTIYTGRLDHKRYINILENTLIPTGHLYYGLDMDWKFQQDNAPCHKARAVNEYFENSNISVIVWPPRSPDLNPIENVWAWIDRKLTENPVHSINALKTRLGEIYDTISAEYCRKLYDSIQVRAAICIKNKGGHIPY